MDRIYRSLWRGWTAVIVCVLVLPLENFRGHAHWHKIIWVPFADRHLSWSDVVLNVLLFLPFGFLISLPFSNRMRLGTVVLLAAGLSASGELYQVFCHNRISSMTDVCTNVAGAFLGASAAAMMRRQDPVLLEPHGPAASDTPTPI